MKMHIEEECTTANKTFLCYPTNSIIHQYIYVQPCTLPNKIKQNKITTHLPYLALLRVPITALSTVNNHLFAFHVHPVQIFWAL